jgi:arylsulfatase A-like enzyme
MPVIRPLNSIRRARIAAALGFLAACLRAAAASPEDARPPNFVVIFCDDLGYQDLGCYGAPQIRTPCLDRMAAEGMRFTDFYVAANVCSPSRLALMTGCYPARAGGLPVLFPNSKIGIHADEVTIAELLKTRGYATAIVGKWHLGHLPPFLPTRHGFDSYFGIPYSNDMPTTSKDGKRGSVLLRNEEVIEHPVDQTTLTERYTEESLRFIEANRDKPFFLYLPHTMPHVPLAVSARFRDKSKGGLYGDVVESLDWSAGQILDRIRTLGLAERTCVVFTSDNGPWLVKKEHGGSALPLRAGKGTVYEGGMREPCIMWWPSRIPAGAVCRELASTIDLLPTFAALAGAAAPNDRIIDGKDIRPLMEGRPGAKTPHDAFFYAGKAVRSGNWKLIAGGRDGPELYDLAKDISEKENVADRHPDVVQRLSRLLEEHRKDIAANARRPGRVD